MVLKFNSLSMNVSECCGRTKYSPNFYYFIHKDHTLDDLACSAEEMLDVLPQVFHMTTSKPSSSFLLEDTKWPIYIPSLNSTAPQRASPPSLPPSLKTRGFYDLPHEQYKLSCAEYGHSRLGFRRNEAPAETKISATTPKYLVAKFVIADHHASKSQTF